MQNYPTSKCPFLECPVKECYVRNLTSLAVEKAISICGGDYERCETYRILKVLESWQESRRHGVAAEGTKHVLLADDEAEFLYSAGLVLRKEGLRVSLAFDGHGAIEIIKESFRRRNVVNLLVTDIQMPGMRGDQLIDAVRESGIHTPVLVITGYLDQNMADDLMRKGCRGVLKKPFTPAGLVDQVNWILNSEDIEPVRDPKVNSK